MWACVTLPQRSTYTWNNHVFYNHCAPWTNINSTVISVRHKRAYAMVFIESDCTLMSPTWRELSSFTKEPMWYSSSMSNTCWLLCTAYRAQKGSNEPPAANKILLGPPGWLATNSVMSYTCPLYVTQMPLSSELCSATSLDVKTGLSFSWPLFFVMFASLVLDKSWKRN